MKESIILLHCPLACIEITRIWAGVGGTMEQEQSKIEKREDSFTITGSNGTIIVREEEPVKKSL